MINLTLSEALIWIECDSLKSCAYVHISVTTERDRETTFFCKVSVFVGSSLATSDPTPQLGQTRILKTNAMRKSKMTDTA
jgi:hypothetical protein